MRPIQSLIKLSPALLAVLLLAAPALAAGACCDITAIDKATGVVTAQELATKRQFQFKVDNAVQLHRLTVGQGVNPDFRAGKVTLEGVGGRFTIVNARLPAPDAKLPPTTAGSVTSSLSSTPPSSARPGPAPPRACCTITGVDPQKGLVTARDNATGRSFTFALRDQKVFKGLRRGQPVHAHFGSRQVSLDGLRPCCPMSESSEASAPGIPNAGGQNEPWPGNPGGNGYGGQGQGPGGYGAYPGDAQSGYSQGSGAGWQQPDGFGQLSNQDGGGQIQGDAPWWKQPSSGEQSGWGQPAAGQPAQPAWDQPMPGQPLPGQPVPSQKSQQ